MLEPLGTVAAVAADPPHLDKPHLALFEATRTFEAPFVDNESEVAALWATIAVGWGGVQLEEAVS